MLVPRKLGDWLNGVLPHSLLMKLHYFYGPYHQWAVGRMSRSLLPVLFISGEPVVASGPFRGMKYLDLSGGSALLPKLLGAYEQELHDALERVLQREYRTVIVVGCAEGYYVVGLARRLPMAAVYGFDLSARSLKACRSLAELNGVSQRVHLAGRATVENLRPLVGPNTLIISDCEGAEVELLNPDRIPALLQADVIVELHDRLVPQVSSLIQRRFCVSHEVSIIHSTDRDPCVYPLLKPLPPKQQRLALEEFRGGPMDWGVLLARPVNSHSLDE